MNDQESLKQCYHRMIREWFKRTPRFWRTRWTDSFVLVHMTEMCQSRRQYIEAIVNGTLNYYSEQTDGIAITVEGDTARLIGQSRISTAVFGSGRHTWRLQLAMSAVKRDGYWYFTGAKASTY